MIAWCGWEWCTANSTGTSTMRRDEFFYVVEGKWIIDVRDEAGAETTITLSPGQGYMVPRGVVHKTAAPERTVILMIEGAGVVPTGDE